MSFLFGKKKGAHNRDGTPPGSTNSAGAVTPPSSNNSSLNHVYVGAGDMGSPGSKPPGPGRPPGSSGGLPPQRPAHQQHQQTTDPATVNANLYPWSQRKLLLSSSHSHPFPRYGHAANAVSSKEGDVYIIGGLIQNSNVRGDLWVVEGANERLDTYPVVTTSEGPGPRVGHASLLVGNAFIVFGGDTKKDERDILDETLYLLNTSTRQWSKAIPPGHRPRGRYGHTLNIVGSKLYVFGGQVDGIFFNDLTSFDLNTLQHPGSRWEVVAPAGEGTSADIPAPRTNHSIVTWNEKLYLFGGTNGTEWFNDVWSFDHRTSQWTQLNCIGYIPYPREGHAAALVGDVMYIFGGRSADGNDLGDLAAFRISSKRWYTFQNMGPSPSPRSGHTMTTVGQKVVVLGGEPSNPPPPGSPPDDLSLVYVLDTTKIRYPNDNPPAQMSPTDRSRPDPRRAPPPRPALEGPPGPGQRSRSGTRDSVISPPPANLSTSPMSNAAAGGSRLPRASMGPAGPPPTQQAPAPRTNGVGAPGKPPILQTQRSRENISPQSVQERRAASSPLGPKPVGVVATPPERNRSRQQQQGSIDSTSNLSPVEEAHSPQQTPAQPQRPQVDIRSVADQPSIPDSVNTPVQTTNNALRDGTQEQVAISLSQMEEFEKLKKQNDWYASELALARRAGYTPQTSTSSLLDERANDNVSDSERPILEAMLALKGELAKVHDQVEKQASIAAKKIQDIERERDNAIQQAVYAKAKLAALGGPSTTPTGERSSDIDQEKMTDMSRKLAASLAAQADLSAKVEVLSQEITAEKKARQHSDEAAGEAERRASELDDYRNWAASEIENLRAELLDAGKAFRDEAAAGQEAAADAKLLKIDQVELTSRLQDAVSENKTFKASLEQMNNALRVSNTKSSTLERQLEEERITKEGLERKLAQVRGEYEEKTADLQSLNQRLKDVEELMTSYAEEAKVANAVLSAGLGKLGERDIDSAMSHHNDERVRVLQEQVDSTKVLLAKSQAQADETGAKLTEAMQRIAGLEYQQGQSSKDSIALRRRMAEVTDDARKLKAENVELSQRLNDKQLEVDAVTAKLNALKEILQERGNNINLDKRRSLALNSPSPVSGSATPEQALRLRELEAKLEESLRAHRDTKNTAEMQAQEIEKHFREKLEQLEGDYHTAMRYVHGTEKMVKRMKDELSKYKAQNIRLQTELEEAQRARDAANSSNSTDGEEWTTERNSLNQEIDRLQDELRVSAASLDSQIREAKSQLDALREERDRFKLENSKLRMDALDASQQYTSAKQIIEKLETDNALLNERAQSAEKKVSMLLDQVEASVDTYRRSTRLDPSNPADISSARSSYYGPDNRTSIALDSLATELDQLRNHWESTNKAYRTSNAFDYEKSPSATTTMTTPISAGSAGYEPSVAQWRNRLGEQEGGEGKGKGPGMVNTSVANGLGVQPAQQSPALAAAGGGF
ncbi:hypothetical protein EX30DRAFT_310548 [Ascodesmis nigricans]|uniref:Galactose oxidase n=1 Tax=Ascodesmis nigricans TaxID=341454 RepID=A0A4S2MLU7_9PEZI|nr:hypothetical protein EX30DRAFT_310548 [Ascodesmis nigricans]